MKRIVLFALIVAFLLSCSNATGPVAMVSATVTRVLSDPMFSSVDATLDVEIDNSTSHEIQLAGCFMSLERKTAGSDWDEVWSLACSLLPLPPGIIIRSGSSRALTVRITAQGNGDTWPSTGLEGTYRLRVAFFPGADVIRRLRPVSNLIVAQEVVSNEFVFPTQ